VDTLFPRLVEGSTLEWGPDLDGPHELTEEQLVSGVELSWAVRRIGSRKEKVRKEGGGLCPPPGWRPGGQHQKGCRVLSAEGKPVGDADELHQPVPGPRLPLQTRGRPSLGF